MKGSEKVLEMLSEALANELTAINQYILHAEMMENWGYSRLAATEKKSSIDEMKHAERIIERILFLEGSPNMSKYLKINIFSYRLSNNIAGRFRSECKPRLSDRRYHLR